MGDGSWSTGVEAIQLPLPLDSAVDDSPQHSGFGGGGLCQHHLGFRKGLAIASLNINGLRGCLDEVKLLLSNLSIHFLALNETKLNKKVPKELSKIRGYQQFRLDRTCSGGE